MVRTLVSITMCFLLFSCSKKSSDTPSPTASNTISPINNNNQTQNDSLSGVFYYTFKGTTYQIKMGSCGGEINGSSFATCFTTNDNYFTNEEFWFDFASHVDSSKFLTLVGKKIKQFNGMYAGEIFLRNNFLPYDTLNMESILNNSNVKYQSYSDDTKDTINTKSNHYFRISSCRYVSHTYSTVGFLISGDFSLAMSNTKDTTDIVTVNGHFKDMPMGGFNRK